MTHRCPTSRAERSALLRRFLSQSQTSHPSEEPVVWRSAALGGFCVELQHQLWFCVLLWSGHWVQLTSDPPTASGGAAISTEKGKTLLSVPHGSLKPAFQGMYFPPWTKHLTLFFPGPGPGKWVIT